MAEYLRFASADVTLGITMHDLLAGGFDSGPNVCHALPSVEEGEMIDGFTLGMCTVCAEFGLLA